MHLEAHAMLGWVLGNLPGSNPQIRRYCMLGALLPDLDGIGFFFSPTAYDRYHHTLGHNVFALGAFAVLMALRCRSWRALALGALSFGSHLLTDAGLSGWPVYLLYPLSGWAFSLPYGVGLAHPVNIHLIYAGYLALLAVAIGCRRTPIELISPKLDRLVVSVWSPRPHRCLQCHRPSNLFCAVCGQPTCLRHTRLRGCADVLCQACARSEAA